jgi:hypothetical protein
MREVATIMGNKYPNMFQDQGQQGRSLITFILNYILILDKLGYGLGGNLGNKQLPNHLVDRVCFKVFWQHFGSIFLCLVQDKITQEKALKEQS